MTNHRSSDVDDAGALARSSQGAWKLLALIASVVAGIVSIVTIDHKLAINAAEAVVAPVEKRIDDHLSSSKAMREVMDRYVAEERTFRRVMSKKMDALCRANPRADCPLGDE